jgi:hypothetical protein
VGFEAGASASLDASLGLSAGISAGASAQVGASTDASLAAGFKLAAAGGVEAAIELSAGLHAAAAVSNSIAAFADASEIEVSPAVRQAPAPGRPQQVRTPLAQAPAASGVRLGQRVGQRIWGRVEYPAPPVPQVDPRATSYGLGIPLRPRVATRRRPSADVDAGTQTLTSNPSAAPWEALPASAPGRRESDQTQADRRPSSCACICDARLRPPWSIEDEQEVDP